MKNGAAAVRWGLMVFECEGWIGRSKWLAQVSFIGLRCGGGWRRNAKLQLNYYSRDRPRIIGDSAVLKDLFAGDVGILWRNGQKRYVV